MDEQRRSFAVPAAQGFLADRVLGHYRLLETLGQGGMGQVYLARDTQLDRDVAVKVLPPESATDETARARLFREARTASALNHPNICTIYEVGEAGGQIYIVMELVEGRPLAALIPSDGLPSETVIRYGAQIAEGLEHAHRRRIVHRDLKSSNVMITPEGRAIVLDFSLAKRMVQPEPDGATRSDASLTQAGQVVGTLHYMAPEVLRGQSADARSDIWSFGVLLAEMASGTRPFRGTTSFELTSAILHEPPAPLPAHVPAGLSTIIQRCLAKEPKERYQHAGEIRAALGVASSATIATASPHTSPWRKRLLIWAVAYAIIAVAALALNVFGIRHRLFRGGGTGPPPSTSAVLPPISEGKYLAVLPFRVLGDRAMLGYAAEGIPEALTAKLFQLPGIHVSSTPSAKEADLAQPLEKIARALGVNLLITGTIQGTPENLRVVANLEDLVSRRRLWSAELTATPQSLLALEDDLYAKVIAALELNPMHDRTARSSEHPTEDMQAYDLYLRGREAARNFQDKKGLESALRFYELALKRDPRFALAYAAVANTSLSMYEETKDPFWTEKALTAARQAQLIDNSASEVHAAMGNVYLSTGNPAAAVEELKRAILWAPNSDAYYVQLASTYVSVGNKTEALAAYQKAIQIAPYYWRNHNAQGAGYFRLGEYDKAAAAYRRVIELAPDVAIGYSNLGATYFSLGKIGEAIPLFQKTISIAPKGLAYSNLGTAYFYLHRYGESVLTFEKAVAMEPNKHLFMGNLADAYRWNGQREESVATYDRAIALAYKALQVNPREADTMRALAKYYAKKGDSSKSIEWIDRSRNVGPESAKLLSDAAIVYALANRQEEALKQLRAALQKGYSAQEARSEPEFKNLQARPEFTKLLAEFEVAKR